MIGPAGIPDLVVGVGVGAFLALLVYSFVARRVERDSLRPVLALVLTAFFVRAMLAVISLRLDVLPASYSSDALTYEKIGLAIVANSVNGTPLPTWAYSPDVWLYGRLNAWSFLVFGAFPVVMQLCNAALGALVAFNTFRLTGRLDSARAGLCAGWIVALFPSAIFFTSVNLRDAVVWFAVSEAAYLLVLLSERKTDVVSVAVLAVAWTWIVLLFRRHTGPVLVLAAAVMLVCGLWQRRTALRSVLMVVLGEIVGVLAMWSPMSIFSPSTPQELSAVRTGLATGGTRILPGLGFENWWHVVGFAPIGAALFLLAPFPWQLDNWVQSVATIENTVFVLLLFLSMREMPRLVRGHPLSWSFILALIVGTALLFGVAEGNIGTAYRHKLQLLPLLAVPVGAYLARRMEELSAAAAVRAV